VAYGPLVIRAEVIPPSGVRTLRVDFFADGVLIGSDPLPPYEAPWDAGKEMGSRVFRAVARFGDGTSAEDLITTRGLSYTQHELVQGTPIDRVQLLVSVTDPNGAPAGKLSAENLEVREGETRVAIKTFKKVEDSLEIPLSIAVLVDRSGSMAFQMQKWAEACVELVSSVRPIDQVRVSAFSEETMVLQDFTHDAISLARSVAAIGPAGGGTRLFRAVFETVRDMRDLPGRKALILLTDGLDTEFSSPSGGITAAMFPMLMDATRMAVRSGVTVILILPGPSGRGYLAVQDLAVQTGGWYMYPSNDLRALLKRLGRRLLASYVVEYDIERPVDLDKKRPVKVTLKGEGMEDLEVHTSLGVYSRLGALEELKRDLSEGNGAQRARAATELGRSGDAAVVPDLIRALKSDSPEVREAAAAALAERKAPEGMEKVLKLIHDAVSSVREAAFEAAVRYGTPAVPRLQEIARGGGPARPAALRALGDIGDPNALPTLIAGLGEKDCALRVAATDGLGWFYALGESGFPGRTRADQVARKNAFDPLRKVLSDPCPAASEAAAVALGRLVDPPALRKLLAASTEVPPPRRIDEIPSCARLLSDEGGAGCGGASSPGRRTDADSRARGRGRALRGLWLHRKAARQG